MKDEVKEFELWLKASIQYHSAGTRFKRIRERFWNRFVELIKQENYEQAQISIDAFRAIRKQGGV